MSDARIGRRYARALMGLAQTGEDLDRILRDVQLLHKVLGESREFVVFLRSPVINKEKKRAVLEEMFAARVGPDTMAFLLLLVEKGREQLLPGMVEQFFGLADERMGIVRVNVRAATDLPPAYHEKIGREFERLTQKKVHLNMSVERSLIGGLVARVGDTVFDGSVKRQLELLREQMGGGWLVKPEGAGSE